MADHHPETRPAHRPFSRRDLLRRGAAVTGATMLAGANLAAANDQSKAAVNGRIKQSLVSWCYKPYWEPEEMAKIAVQLGCVSIELIDPKDWPMLKKHGLVCAIAGSHGFQKGMNNPENWDYCLELLRERIDQCAEAGFKRVITFTGMRENISDDDGIKNCVDGYKKIIGHAEKQGVTLCLEMLNTRDDTHPMKGHPGYQGDHTEYCIEIIKKVGSPNFKLLFDIYHVQIMDGDVIRRIHQFKDYLGHIHTAGNPGRGELDDQQEINYPAVMQALLDVGYDGYVGQEFIPTRDPLEGLQEAVKWCDV